MHSSNYYKSLLATSNLIDWFDILYGVIDFHKINNHFDLLDKMKKHSLSKKDDKEVFFSYNDSYILYRKYVPFYEEGIIEFADSYGEQYFLFVSEKEFLQVMSCFNDGSFVKNVENISTDSSYRIWYEDDKHLWET